MKRIRNRPLLLALPLILAVLTGYLAFIYAAGQNMPVELADIIGDRAALAGFRLTGYLTDGATAQKFTITEAGITGRFVTLEAPPLPKNSTEAVQKQLLDVPSQMPDFKPQFERAAQLLTWRQADESWLALLQVGNTLQIRCYDGQGTLTGSKTLLTYKGDAGPLEYSVTWYDSPVDNLAFCFSVNDQAHGTTEHFFCGLRMRAGEITHLQSANVKEDGAAPYFAPHFAQLSEDGRSLAVIGGELVNISLLTESVRTALAQQELWPLPVWMAPSVQVFQNGGAVYHGQLLEHRWRQDSFDLNAGPERWFSFELPEVVGQHRSHAILQTTGIAGWKEEVQ